MQIYTEGIKATNTWEIAHVSNRTSSVLFPSKGFFNAAKGTEADLRDVTTLREVITTRIFVYKLIYFDVVDVACSVFARRREKRMRTFVYPSVGSIGRFISRVALVRLYGPLKWIRTP